jgi:hypothetical protein
MDTNGLTNHAVMIEMTTTSTVAAADIVVSAVGENGKEKQSEAIERKEESSNIKLAPLLENGRIEKERGGDAGVAGGGGGGREGPSVLETDL